MNLLSLPNEILSSLPFYIDNIETFTNAASSCRRLRENFATCAKTYPKTILLLASASKRLSQHFLVAATARQISRLALRNNEDTVQLQKVFRGGINSLHDFCIDNPNIGLTMEDIRRLHQTVNRLGDQIDEMTGDEWYRSVNNSWKGGIGPIAVFSIIIYGELFASSMQAFLESEEKLLPSFDVRTRLDYIKYCIIPDDAIEKKDAPGPVVLVENPQSGYLVSLRKVLHCRPWRRMWAKAIRMIDRNFEEAEQEEDEDIGGYHDEPWNRRLYRNALQTQGLEGMQLVTLPKEGISKECRDQALRIKQQVELLQEKFDDVELETRLEDAPDPAREVKACSVGRFASEFLEEE
ncbi:hypothetical protein V8E54_010726 [Elaphomyces granulatus]